MDGEWQTTIVSKQFCIVLRPKSKIASKMARLRAVLFFEVHFGMLRGIATVVESFPTRHHVLNRANILGNSKYPWFWALLNQKRPGWSRNRWGYHLNLSGLLNTFMGEGWMCSEYSSQLGITVKIAIDLNPWCYKSVYKGIPTTEWSVWDSPEMRPWVYSRCILSTLGCQ